MRRLGTKLSVTRPSPRSHKDRLQRARCQEGFDCYHERMAVDKRWKLFFVTDDKEFECDFVIARTAVGAERVFKNVYEDLPGNADLVIEIKRPPSWLKKPTWLGPDPNLEEFGGERLLTMDFPRWKFGRSVWGSPKTLEARYAILE